MERCDGASLLQRGCRMSQREGQADMRDEEVGGVNRRIEWSKVEQLRGERIVLMLNCEIPMFVQIVNHVCREFPLFEYFLMTAFSLLLLLLLFHSLLHYFFLLFTYLLLSSLLYSYLLPTPPLYHILSLSPSFYSI